jgi:hypothetical protein
MSAKPRTSRVVVWVSILIGFLALGFAAYGHIARPSRPVAPTACQPIPSNVVKLGHKVAVSDPDAMATMSEMGWPELRSKLRKGDIVQEFETQTTGGHLVMRGDCYLGQALAWIR